MPSETPKREIWVSVVKANCDESLASRSRRRINESGARFALRVERIRASAGEGVRLDAGADLMGVYHRRVDVCGDVHSSRTDPGRAGAADLRAFRGSPGLGGIFYGQPHDFASIPLCNLRRRGRGRERVRLLHADAGRIQMVSGQAWARRRLDGWRVWREFGNSRPGGDEPDRVHGLASDVSS